DIRASYPHIPWQEIAGMRDKLAHEYFGVDLEIVWETSQKDLQEFYTAVSNIKSSFPPD
ncbi:MAG: DUF86 domain-containing protein, partial [Deltaproteobacteria bacterium]|nr:DUF86 domain-containing protein [Deltaproteobacteria bacterium]